MLLSIKIHRDGHTTLPATDGTVSWNSCTSDDEVVNSRTEPILLNDIMMNGQRS